jgi:tetratricopeptide (TPR) repeat protein
LLVALLVLFLASAAALAYFYIWLPEMQRAREEEARTSQLQREQADHEAKSKAAEQRAKDELLQSLATAAARDAGPSVPLDAGPPPQGVRPALPATAQEVTPALPVSALSTRGSPPGASAVGPSAPKTYEDWMAEATRLRTHERVSSALDAYESALALQPRSAEAHTGRGLALFDLGRRHEALLEFNRALELDPRDGVAVLGLAETYRSLGRVEEARGAYQRYLEGWPGSSEARAARAALESLKE